MFQKINQIAMFAFIALGAIFMVVTMQLDLPEGTTECTDCWSVGAFIGLSYLLFGLSTLAAIVGSVMGSLANPKGLKGSLISVGALVLLLVLSYVMSSGEVMEGWTVTESVSKWSGTGLFAFYILFIVAVLSIVYSSVSRFIK